MTNKKFQTMVKELFIRCRKLNILLVFITQSYFSVPKEVRLFRKFKLENSQQKRVATNCY